ncbi:MAG: HEAT repeat domain-containing protein [Deltaproteobacteria bacterium]|nr:HEAT repeat domain-containing protein [Deltaproteobacteria bacterium]
MNTHTHSNFYAHDEKIKFAPDEFMKAQIACDFVVDLTKAISRSGYYDPAHPSSREVKEGLYGSFQRALGGAPEIMLTCRETDSQPDIYIVGILDEPAGMRRLTRTNIAIIFIPKLREYFERKGLLSVTIKKKISPQHFESFVDIMSEPMADFNDDATIGKCLTKALVDAGIHDVSLVFKNDLVLADGRLPWRVAITLRRLAKDLSVIPMFRDTSSGEIKRIKVQIIHDIIRPLRHPDLLRDLIVNCDVITSCVAHIEFDELEQLIIHVLPRDILLPTSLLVLEEYEQEKNALPQDDGTPACRRRCDGIETVLRLVSERIVAEDLPEASNLLERLYEHRMIRFESLPERLREQIGARTLARDVVAHMDACVRKIQEAASVYDMENLVNLFRRVIPELLLQEEWAVVNEIVKVFSDVSSKKMFSSEASGLPSSLADAIFDGSEETLIEAYMQAGLTGRQKINDVLMKLGPRCITILDAVFSRCESPEVWKSAIDVLCRKGDPARGWALQVLGDWNRSASIASAALIIIGYVGQSHDTAQVKKYLKHENPRLRIKALDASARLNRKEAEPLIIDALHDEDEKVWNHAVSSLTVVSPLSEESVSRLLELIKRELPDDKKDTVHRAHNLARLVKAVGALADAPHKELLEDAILSMTAGLLKEKRGLFAFFKAGTDKERLEVIHAGISSLGKIGGEKSLAFLQSLARSKSPVSGIAEETIRRLGHTFA